ncbi:MAG: hypothetical protein OEM39_04580 [Acidimicrobiia bacterium]|nr:hypothetical protein [Acidimicrobiia bacterium]
MTKAHRLVVAALLVAANVSIVGISSGSAQIANAAMGEIVAEATWDAGNGHTYVVVRLVGEHNWQAANDDVVSLLPGYHLVTSTSQQENDFIAALLQSVPTGDVYIGALQEPIDEPDANRGWTWVTGEPWDFTAWQDGEPNDGGRPGDEQWVETRPDGSWNDINDSVDSRWGYVAESVFPQQISGTVTDEFDSTLHGICVEAWVGAVLDSATTTLADGSYVLPVQVGDYTVYFHDCGLDVWGAEWFDDVAEQVGAATVIVAEDATVVGIDAVLDVVQRCNGFVATIVGTQGDDVISGASTADVVLGLGGNDIIKGFAGADHLCGGPGRDTISGGGGNDIVSGGVGNDVLLGGVGDDVLEGGAGWDKIYPGEGVDDVNGGSGSRDWVYYSGAKRGVVVSLRTGVGAGQGRDSLVSIENIVGSKFDDKLIGNSRSNRIIAGAGDDRVWGKWGNDFLWGDAGSDVLQGNQDDDRVLGGPGDDVLYGGTGDDVAFGEVGDDAIYGGPGDDDVRGGPGSDGVAPGRGVDFAHGGIGIDLVSYFDAKIGVTVDLTNRTATFVEVDTVSRFEWVEGSELGDTLVGDVMENLIFGLGGNDTIDGMGGADLLFGEGGHDTLRGNGGIDTLVGGPGNDSLDGGAGADTASYYDVAGGVVVNLATGTASGDGNDTLISVEDIVGSPGVDILTGNSGANWIEGRAAGDTIRGGSGDDLLLGMYGNDSIFGDSGNDGLDGGPGSDTLNGGVGTDFCMNGESHSSCETIADVPRANISPSDPSVTGPTWRRSIDWAVVRLSGTDSGSRS